MVEKQKKPSGLFKRVRMQLHVGTRDKVEDGDPEAPLKSPPAPSPDAIEVICLLGISNIETKDVEYIPMGGEINFQQDDITRGMKVFRSEDFTDMFSQPKSAALLAHGDFPSHPVGPEVSVLSAIVADLHSSQLAGLGDHVLPLIYFCSRHMDTRNHEYTGGWAMIASLCRQLLQRYHGDLPEVLAGRVPSQLLREKNVREICKLFAHMIRNLPPSTIIYCIIDGVVHYEREEFWPDTEIVLECLAGLVAREPGSQVVFRLVVTSPGPVAKVSNQFGENELTVWSME